MKKIDISTQKFPDTFALVDDKDYDWLNQWKWTSWEGYGTIYACRMDGTLIFMHRVILETPPDKLSDHRDGNGLNNQRYNLRICSKSENSRNCKKHCKSSSIYKGVSLDKRLNLWEARITYNRKHIFLGRHKIESDAALAYDRRALELFGEFANLNFPERQSVQNV